MAGDLEASGDLTECLCELSERFAHRYVEGGELDPAGPVRRCAPAIVADVPIPDRTVE
jgi:hypothetical protein